MKDLGTTTRQGGRAHARAACAFTLLELLLVISLLAVLASITLVVGQGVSERSRIAQARAEMAVLAAALEQYKQHYGDYPWTPEAAPAIAALTPPPPVLADSEGAILLFNALCGNIGPAGAQLPDRTGDGVADKGRTLVDLAKFQLWLPESQLPDPDLPTIVNNWFADPWGKWYYYHYRKDRPGTSLGDEWKSKGFLLYSHGPDGECAIGPAESSGYYDEVPTDEASESVNQDNVYYGRK